MKKQKIVIHKFSHLAQKVMKLKFWLKIGSFLPHSKVNNKEVNKFKFKTLVEGSFLIMNEY